MLTLQYDLPCEATPQISVFETPHVVPISARARR